MYRTIQNDSEWPGSSPADHGAFQYAHIRLHILARPGITNLPFLDRALALREEDQRRMNPGGMSSVTYAVHDVYEQRQQEEERQMAQQPRPDPDLDLSDPAVMSIMQDLMRETDIDRQRGVANPELVEALDQLYAQAGGRESTCQ